MNRSKIVAVWVIVAVLAVLALGIGVFATTRDNPPAGAQTVAEAIGGGVLQNDNSTAPSNIDEERMYSLAEALGIPPESMPRDMLESANRSESRGTMIQVLRKAIEQGVLNDEEAAVILKAFDLGLVNPAVDTIVAESSPAQ